MPGLWKAWKAKGRLPTLSTSPLGISPKAARFPHSHSSDDEGGWKSGKPKAGFPLSHRPDSLLSKPKHNDAGRAIALRLPSGAPRRLQPATSSDSVTFSREATRPGKVVDAGQTPDCADDLVNGDPGAGDQLDQWQQQLSVSLGELLDCRSRGLLFSIDDVISFLHGGGVPFEGWWFWRIDSIEPGSLPPLNLQLNLRHPPARSISQIHSHALFRTPLGVESRTRR